MNTLSNHSANTINKMAVVLTNESRSITKRTLLASQESYRIAAMSEPKITTQFCPAKTSVGAQSRIETNKREEAVTIVNFDHFRRTSL